MAKIKKQKDGMYYEKIITWKKKPKYYFIFLSILSLIYFTIMVYIVMSTNTIDEALDNFFYRFIILTNFGVILCGSLFGFFMLLANSFGEGKKIKFRRINS